MSKSSRLVLLGAGASVDAGVPTAYEMTREMARAFETDRDTDLARALAVIVGGLQLGAGWEHQQLVWDVDIERVINAAHLLADRFNAELSPFVGNWHPVLEELERHAYQGGIHSHFDNFSMGVSSVNSLSQAERAINTFVRDLDKRFKTVLSLIRRRPDGQLFDRLSTALTNNLVRFTWITEIERVAYLNPLVAAAARESVPIVTLNYDNAVELCSDTLGLKCDTGLDRWRETNRLSVQSGPSGNVDLIKLHGSINWAWDRGGKFVRSVSLVSADKMESRRRGSSGFYEEPQLAVVFGGKNKLTAAGPFLDLLFWFRESLRLCNELVLIGYSFRDDHVNQIIRSWFHKALENRVVVVTQPGNRSFLPPNLARMGLDPGRVQVKTVGAVGGIAELFQ